MTLTFFKQCIHPSSLSFSVERSSFGASLLFPHDWIKILNINIIQVILCPFQGIIYSGTWCPSALHCWCQLWSPGQVMVQLHGHVVTIFSLAAKKQSVRRYFSTMHIPCSASKLSPLIYHHWWFLSELVFTVIVAKCWFLNSTPLYISINHLSAFLLNQELSFPQLFAYLFIISMHS